MEFSKAKGVAFVRQGVRPPWHEIEFRQKDGTVVKVVGKVVDHFLSEGWEKKEKVQM